MYEKIPHVNMAMVMDSRSKVRRRATDDELPTVLTTLQIPVHERRWSSTAGFYLDRPDLFVVMEPHIFSMCGYGHG